MSERPRRTRAEMWREDLPPEDSAPEHTASVALADYGVTVDDARELLHRQMCPLCGEGPWKSPLNHVARKHGIGRHDMRDMCGLNVTESVADPDLSERFSERGKTLDLTAATEASRRRGPQRWTQAGLEKQRSTLRAWENSDPERAQRQREEAARKGKTLEARAKQGASMRANWEGLSPEERAERVARLYQGPEHMDRMRAAKVLQPCGTVAAYKRGCRCEPCREAKRASRR